MPPSTFPRLFAFAATLLVLQVVLSAVFTLSIGSNDVSSHWLPNGLLDVMEALLTVFTYGYLAIQAQAPPFKQALVFCAIYWFLTFVLSAFLYLALSVTTEPWLLAYSLVLHCVAMVIGTVLGSRAKSRFPPNSARS